MGGILITSAYQLYVNVFNYLWRGSNRGVAYHLVFGLINTFQWDKDPVFIIPIGIILGLVALIVRDDYKRTYGMMLVGIVILGIYVMGKFEILVPHLDWVGNLEFLVLGLLLGVLFGTVHWDDGVKFGLLDNDTDTWEFPRALPRLLLLVGALVVYSVFERWLVYQSGIIVTTSGLGTRSWEFVGFHWPTFPTNLVFGLLFLLSLYLVRQYAKDQTTLLVGPTGSGKTTLMAGMSYTLSRLGKVNHANEAVTNLETRFIGGGFDDIPSTQSERIIPLEITFRHGYLFPKKVTIRTVDYAGEHVGKIRPRRSESEVITDDADQAFSIAEYLCWQQDQLIGPDDDTEPFFRSDPDGTAPGTVDGWPKSLDEMSNAELAVEIIRDMLWHSDTVGLVLPMDLFSDRLLEDGMVPEYVSFEDGELDLVSRPRALDADAFLSRCMDIHSSYGEDTSIFYILTFADIAHRHYGIAEGNYADDWADFTDHIVEYLIPETATKYLQGMFPNRTKRDGVSPDAGLNYRAENVVPVHFQIETGTDDEGDVEPVLVDPHQPMLRGTRWLSERVGRTKGFDLWG